MWAEGQAGQTLVVNGVDSGVPLWVADRRRERRIGLLGTDDLDGALWITRCSSVHCVGMRYTIDVVHVTRTGRVLSVRSMPPGRVGLPRLRAAAVVELPAGQAARLGIEPGGHLARR